MKGCTKCKEINTNKGNYGQAGWHIDHIKPLSKFDLTEREQFLKASHYTNLQPMWAEENIRKNNKYTEITENGNLKDKGSESSYFFSNPST